jgi:hypothetical protein
MHHLINTMAKSTPTMSTMEMQMQLALADLATQDEPNYSATADRFKPVNHQTLKRRFLKEQQS